MTAPLVALEGVSRRFGRGPTAVQAVRSATLRLCAGEVVVVMGPSGSGKSTLLCLVAGLLHPDAGRAAIAGRSLSALAPGELLHLRRTRVGFVFQHFNLLRALSALENVELGLWLAGRGRREARRRAAAGLEEVDLAARAHAVPRDLAGGEQQRVAVARALAPGPDLILADEPTGSLDAANGRRVIELICRHTRRAGACSMLVTHDHRVADAADRRLWMEDGMLRESA